MRNLYNGFMDTKRPITWFNQNAQWSRMRRQFIP